MCDFYSEGGHEAAAGCVGSAVSCGSASLTPRRFIPTQAAGPLASSSEAAGAGGRQEAEAAAERELERVFHKQVRDAWRGTSVF